MNPDQLASSSGSTLFLLSISGFILLLKEFVHVYGLITVSASFRSQSLIISSFRPQSRLLLIIGLDKHHFLSV